MEKTLGSVAIVGADDFIGSEIAKKFAAQGYAVYAGRRRSEKLAPLFAQVRAQSGIINGRSLDARRTEDVAAFLAEAETIAPLELVIFNVGANVQFPILETTDRVFQKVWEMACFAGFITGREATRIMLPRNRGKIFFTGATASLRGRESYAAFAAAKSALRTMAQAMARELWPQHIHVAHLVIDAAVDTKWVREMHTQFSGQEQTLNVFNSFQFMPPAAVADAYWQLFQQPPTAWTFEQEIRPYGERW